MQDLYSRTQSGQEFQTFENFYPPSFEKKHYIVSLGASVSWQVHGGSNFWKEFKDDYNTSWTVAGENPSLLSLSVQSQQETDTVLTVGCKVPVNLQNASYAYQVDIKQTSRVSRHLLRPKAHSAQALISCQLPAAQRLLWSQG